MARLVGLKIFLILVSVLLGLWNYFLRDSFSFPYLSELSTTIVYVIVGGLVLLIIVLNWTIREHY